MICLRKFLRAEFGAALGLALVLSTSLAGRNAQAPTPAPPPQAPARPQAPPPPQDQTLTGPTIRSNVQLVVVPVTVKDHGQLVSDLRRDEFRILEDGVEQKITLFSTDTVPLSVVVAIDGDLKAGAADRVKKSLISMVGGFSASDEIALGQFDTFYTPLLDFTSDTTQLISQLKRINMKDAFAGGSQPVTQGPSINGYPVAGAPSGAQIPNSLGKSTKHIDDAVYGAAELLRTRDPQRRRMIILISDGTNARYNTHGHEDTLRLVLSSNISVYAIGVDQAVILRGTTVLSHYAHATGGDVYYAINGSILSDFYSQVTEEARHQYTLGYVPAKTDPLKSYHSIEVRIRRPGLTLLTRDGYYSAGMKP